MNFKNKKGLLFPFIDHTHLQLLKDPKIHHQSKVDHHQNQNKPSLPLPLSFRRCLLRTKYFAFRRRNKPLKIQSLDVFHHRKISQTTAKMLYMLC